ncbi:hypothetical protein [Actinopolymorpha alba]|uniref:hypothetical protein n=1 Tax=Actinopolymorpha alba TaxID=533267 RepID=UPI00039DF261|nr:hypothetical protein [Actinopolymorpha alba]
MVRIVVDDLSGPRIAAFLDEHVQEMRSITPLESKHALDHLRSAEPRKRFGRVLSTCQEVVREVRVRLLRAIRGLPA